jgi:tRNA-splicing ligase RtcB
MSRGEANKLISLEEHAKAMTGIEARLDADVLDESPRAYKDINAVMAAQEDLVDIIHHLHQVLNVKG